MKTCNRLKLLINTRTTYAVQLCIAEYRSPHTVFESIVQSTLHLSLQDSLEKLETYIGGQTVSLDVSEGEMPQEAGSGLGLTFKLTCPLSLSPIDVPVRGQECRHFQCFDLFSFIKVNSFPTQRRWNCPLCDHLVFLESLEVCGLFKDILEKRRTEIMCGGTDSVKIFPDGRWELVSSAAMKKRRSGTHLYEVSKREKVVEHIVLD